MFANTKVGLYAKAAFAALMALLTTAYASLDGENFNFSDKDYLNIVIAAVTAIGVYLIPNASKSEV